jgi:hypothetical protein
MKPIRRFTALLTGIFVLQLMLLGAAAPCPDAMAGVPAAESDGGHEAAGAHAEVSDNADCGDHANGSTVPSRSGATSCMSMISCVTAVPHGATRTALTGTTITSGLAALTELAPDTRNTIPEPPPPRA